MFEMRDGINRISVLVKQTFRNVRIRVVWRWASGTSVKRTWERFCIYILGAGILDLGLLYLALGGTNSRI